MLTTIVAVALAYLIGSLPFASLMARRWGFDLRLVGSRNPGASNVLRTAGVGPAIVVMLGDAAKGALAVVIAHGVAQELIVACAAGVAAVAGHVYSPWLGFRGGKGVATAAGVFAVLTPIAAAIAVAVFVATVVVTRFISAGSLVAAVVLPLAAAAESAPGVVVATSIVAAAIVVSRHRDNLARLAAGTERRIGTKA